MANVVVVGAQWGDEGKGKIVDWLSERADVIARFQGGHNAGHTLVIDGQVYKLNALPSGVVRGGKLSVIGNGVVLDPWHLVGEIASIREQGVEISPETLDDRRKHAADLAISWRTRPCARGPEQCRPRSGRPGAASVRPMRTRSGAGSSGSRTWRTRRRCRCVWTGR
jgi:hypothetical protein